MKPTWSYSADGGLEYPVQPGDVWQVGPHRFQSGDVEEEETLPALLTLTDRPALLYVDLPYNAGLARGYRTKAGVDGEAGRQVDYPALVHRTLAPFVGVPDLWVYVETSLRSLTTVVNVGEDAGLPVRGLWQITYYRTKPAALVAFGPDGSVPDLTGLDDEVTPGAVIAHHTEPGEVVVDPMVGRGLTAVAAASRGRVALGNELHPARLSVTLRKMAELTGFTPVCAARTTLDEFAPPA